MTIDTWQHTVSDIEQIVLSACIRESNVDDVLYRKFEKQHLE